MTPPADRADLWNRMRATRKLPFGDSCTSRILCGSETAEVDPDIKTRSHLLQIRYCSKIGHVDGIIRHGGYASPVMPVTQQCETFFWIVPQR